MYIARQSQHIHDDIIRNWSSWNFGQDGFNGTYDDLKEAMKGALENDDSFFISGFDLYGLDIVKADIRELHENYWVLVDTVNGGGGSVGIFGTPLKANSLKEAIKESKEVDYSGEGYRFDARLAELVYSLGEIHIFRY
jgi:hypothetical protein